MRSILYARLRDQRGITVPLSLFVIALLMLLGGVAMGQSVFTSDESNEDRRVKRALQAADAGLEAAVYRMNMFDTINQTSKCVQPNETEALYLTGYERVVAGVNWCTKVSQDIGGRSSYSYEVSGETPRSGAGVDLSDRWVVATGYADRGLPTEETRRVAAKAEAVLPSPLFGDWTVSSKRAISLDSSASVTGSIRSNENITLRSSTRVNCLPDGSMGVARPGPGFGVQLIGGSSSTCNSDRSPAADLFELDPISSTAPVNDNARLGNPTASPSTKCTAGDVCTESNNVLWDPVKRTLRLNSSASVTLGGGVYSFCRLELYSSSQIIIPAKPEGTSTGIFIDKPENCPGVSTAGSPGAVGPGSVYLDSSSAMRNQNSNPLTLQFYMLGSPTIATKFSMLSSTSTKMTLYAPETDFRMESSATLTGAVAAKSINMLSSTKIIYDPRVRTLRTDAVFPLMRQREYRECQNPAPSAVPDSGC